MNKWSKALATTTIIFIVLSIYLVLRRGYYNAYIVNKVLGSTSAVLAALTLLAGPLGRKFRTWSPLLAIRRELGLSALGVGLLHPIVSLIFLSDRFALSWYQREWIPVLAGGIAITIWLCIASISTPAKIKQLGGAQWVKYQQWGGWTAFILVYIHLVVMKYEGWVKWFQGQTKASPELANPAYPPASLFVLVILTGVIVYRLLLYFRRREKI